MKSEPTNLARKTPLPQSQISDTNLNGAANGTGYESTYIEVVGDHPVYTPSAGLPNDIITSRGLNANGTAGIIAKPSFGGGMPDNMIQSSQSVTNAEAMGELNNGYDHVDRSIHVSPQEAGPGGQQWQTPQ